MPVLLPSPFTPLTEYTDEQLALKRAALVSDNDDVWVNSSGVASKLIARIDAIIDERAKKKG